MTVAMIAMMNSTKKAMSKLTMSMMTTITIVQHLDFAGWVVKIPFSVVKFAFIQGVLWSSRCCCL